MKIHVFLQSSKTGNGWQKECCLSPHLSLLGFKLCFWLAEYCIQQLPVNKPPVHPATPIARCIWGLLILLSLWTRKQTSVLVPRWEPFSVWVWITSLSHFCCLMSPVWWEEVTSSTVHMHMALCSWRVEMCWRHFSGIEFVLRLQDGIWAHSSFRSFGVIKTKVLDL